MTKNPSKKSVNDGGNDYTFYLLCTLLALSFFIIVVQIPSSKNLPLVSQKKVPKGSKCQCESSKDLKAITYKDELEEALAGAATEDKTVILALVNKAYVEGDKSMFDIFLDGFWLGDDTSDLIKHLLIVALDQTAYERCRFLRLHCYMLQVDGVDFAAGEEKFMSANFVKLVWRRILFMGDVAKRGYNFIFTDTDILWLRNPFPSLKLNESMDLQISSDYIDARKHMQHNFVNTGFYMIRSNNKTIALLDAWYANKDEKRKEQDILVDLLGQGLVGKLGLKIQFLDTLYFGGFCQDRDVAKIITFHSNCCVTINAKVADLTTALHDWKNYKSSNSKDTTSFKWTFHNACHEAAKHL